ncbi:MAG: glycosyltransferase [Ktedonobacteraceae bacterium]|nr:glycosyltransferase [Ktedonobacteraceae bacterium]
MTFLLRGLLSSKKFLLTTSTVNAVRQLDPALLAGIIDIYTREDKDVSNLAPSPTYAAFHLDGNTLRIARTHSAEVTVHTKDAQEKDAVDAALEWLRQNAQEGNLQFLTVAYREDERLRNLLSRLWLEEDIVPYAVRAGDSAYDLPLEQLVRAASSRFDEQHIARIQVTPDREVQVSDLVTLEDYRHITPPQDFARLQELAQALQGKKLVFINATPQGGGVALARHGLIRLLRLLGVDAHWHVLLPSQEAFRVTKFKFHNVLQAVAGPDVVLTEEDRAIYEAWIKENATVLEPVFTQADVIIIDDEQPAGLIPYIKQANAGAKIIYRSHIQVVASLASTPDTPQYITWQYLWQFIQHADLFISHPVRTFIPEGIPAQKICYMPPPTDPLDGLNKPLTEEQMSAYLKLFDTLLQQQGQTPLDRQRPYIVQIARFDPSKGIPDVLEAYRRLRIKLEARRKPIPQLIIAGVGSIDDPDGIPVYSLIRHLLTTERYASFAEDIKVARLPHVDQLLNTLVRKSYIVLQLSIKEGFEVKVTEALMKGKPVIAYRTGGIPLQIQHGVTGYLVDPGEIAQVAHHLYTLLTDSQRYERMSKAAAELANRDYLTVGSAICWLYLAQQLAGGAKLEGNYQWVKALAMGVNQQ